MCERAWAARQGDRQHGKGQGQPDRQCPGNNTFYPHTMVHNPLLRSTLVRTLRPYEYLSVPVRSPTDERVYLYWRSASSFPRCLSAVHGFMKLWLTDDCIKGAGL